jgi:hypothetical protein
MTSRRHFLRALSLSFATGLLGCGRARNIDIAGTAVETADDPPEADEAASPRSFTAEGTVLGGQAIDVDVPLLQRIHELDAGMSRIRPSAFDYGFGCLGLRLASTLKNEGYWCTPSNSIAFGGTGGDGFHFSFVVTGNRVDAASPIVGSAPDFSADPPLANVILAANFKNFLRLGLTRGFFGMYVFVHRPATALAAYGSPDWRPSDISHYAAGLDVDDHKSEITRHIATALNLTPLAYTAADFQALQDEYKPLLKFKSLQ